MSWFIQHAIIMRKSVNVHFSHINIIYNLLFANCFGCAKMLLLTRGDLMKKEKEIDNIQPIKDVRLCVNQ